ncbi:MAG: hypothetical protein M3Q56_11565 [Bacteroidota bacterium]|nr:hypothetical protein [Bacteroidota bacterium]
MMDKKASKSPCCCFKNSQKETACNKNKKDAGNCNDQDCPCPQNRSNFQIGNISTQQYLNFPDYFSSYKTAWYYIQEIPSIIYLSIWLKPKISSANIL